MAAEKRRERGEGSLFWDPKRGRWRGRVPIGGGRPPREVSGKTQAEARRKWNELKRSLAQGLPAPSDKLKLGAYLDSWLEDVIKPNRAPGTHRGYAVNVRRHIKPALGHVPLAQLTVPQVRKLLNDLAAKGLSPRSAQYVRAVLCAALHQAERDGLVARNVAALTDPPRVKREEVQPFTPAEAHALLDAIKGDRLEVLYSVAIAVGLRISEALGLRWQDVDLERGRVQVRTQLQRVDGEWQIAELKTPKSRRNIDLPAFAVEALRGHRKRQLEERLALGEDWQDWGLVFTTSKGTPFDRHNVTRYFGRTLRRLGLDHKRFHDLRHTAASLMLAQGIPLHEVSAILGHSGIQITSDTYGHLYDERRREVADRMDAFFRGAR